MYSSGVSEFFCSQRAVNLLISVGDREARFSCVAFFFFSHQNCCFFLTNAFLCTKLLIVLTRLLCWSISFKEKEST